MHTMCIMIIRQLHRRFTIYFANHREKILTFRMKRLLNKSLTKTLFYRNEQMLIKKENALCSQQRHCQGQMCDEKILEHREKCKRTTQWNSSCKATPFESEMWPTKRGDFSGVKINTPV